MTPQRFNASDLLRSSCLLTLLHTMQQSDRRLGLLCCLLALGRAFQPPRRTPPPRHTMQADAASILDSTLSLANSEEFLGGIVGFLPFIARPSAIIKLSGRESATAQSRPSRHRRDASSMAWRCEFPSLTARCSQRNRLTDCSAHRRYPAWSSASRSSRLIA